MFNVSLISFCFILFTAANDELDYGIVIDAGSSHTGVFVYKWPRRVTTVSNHALVLPESQPLAVVGGHSNIKEPIGAYANHPNDVSEVLSQVVDFCTNLLADQKSRWGDFPIYLKATAGVRSLPRESREALMQAVREYFSSDAVPFLYDSSYVVILSGEEEGYYGWLSTNYWYNRLMNSQSTYGALDMGGQSLQITWEVEPSSNILEYMSIVRLFEETHRLYTHSFQGYGSNASFTSVLSQDVSVGQNPSEVIFTPCLLPGMEYIFPINGTFYKFNGSGNLNGCIKEVIEFLNLEEDCKNSVFDDECTTTGIYFPVHQIGDTPFYGFSGFGYLQANLEKLGFKKNPTLDELSGLLLTIFDFTISELADIVPNVPLNFIAESPFQLVYIVELLRVFGFSESSKQLHFTINADNGEELNWATGSIVNDANLLNSAYEPDSSSDEINKMYRILCIALAAFLAISIAVNIYCFCKTQEERRPKYSLNETLHDDKNEARLNGKGYV